MPDITKLHLDAAPLTALQESLLPQERFLLQDEAPVRTREIMAGRTLARRVMDGMGMLPAAILRDPNGAPIWPEGLCGSISHSTTRAAVALARLSDLASVGIDIVDERSLGRATAGIATQEEVDAYLAASLASRPEHAARLIFSAKEALFKCQAPVTGNQDLDFPEVLLLPDGVGAFRVRSCFGAEADRGSVLRKIFVSYQQIQMVTVAVAILPTDENSV